MSEDAADLDDDLRSGAAGAVDEAQKSTATLMTGYGAMEKARKSNASEAVSMIDTTARKARHDNNRDDDEDDHDTNHAVRGEVTDAHCHVHRFDGIEHGSEALAK